MIVNVQDFLKNIGKGPIPRLVLFTAGKAPFGKSEFEPYLAEEAVDRLIQAHVPHESRDLAFTSVYAGETSPAAVAEEVQTIPFLVDRRVVLVRQAEVFFALSNDKKSALAPLMACVENPPETGLLILVAPVADKRKRLFKACEENGIIVECPQLDAKPYAAWIKECLKKRGYSISESALVSMIDRVGDRMSDMSNAINLVCNFAQAQTNLTEEHVAAACADVAESTVWILTDAIAASNTAAALESFHELLAMNKSHEEILGTINWLLESAYRAHPETKLSLNKPFVEKKVMPLARKFDLNKLTDALRLCTRTNFGFRNTGTDKTLMMEMLIIKLAAVRSSGSAGR